jgi:trans-2,3-dihydro-3-hydroxyanthranilate isomerase
MSKSYRYVLLDVFTDRLFGGNQLAVFLDGRGLSASTMQAIAKEMNFSESTFILPPERPETDVRMRIFTPGTELPMAGHPTIGSTFALARIGVIGPERNRLVFGLGIGPTPVSLTWRDRDLAFAWMTQLNPIFGEIITDRNRAAAAIGLPTSDLIPRLPVQVVSSGAPFVFMPLATRQAVDNASPDGAAVARFLHESKVDAHGVFLFSTEPGGDAATVYSRMFSTGPGIVEDPATGGASGPLGCYLIRNKMVPPGKASEMLSLQGAKMGRPSHVHISIGIEETGELNSVRVGGEAVVAGEGTLYVS